MLLHRYTRLTLALFLCIVGGTGSVLAFYQELDRWLNPELLTVAVPPSAPLDPLALREPLEAADPRVRVACLTFPSEPGDVLTFGVQPRLNPATGEDYQPGYSEIYFDPYTGAELGRRLFGAVSLGKRDVLSFLYRLHYSLALPEWTANAGGYLLGAVALLWSLDCCVGFYLTLPPARKHGRTAVAPARIPRSFWQRWKPAWQIKPSRFNYDLHRASGLWVWPMLFIFAWSSVGFNLQEVYGPVMRTLFAMHADLPERNPPLDTPTLSWDDALIRGRHLLREQATLLAVTVARESVFSLDRTHGVYQLTVKTNADWSKRGSSSISFDANDGSLKSVDLVGRQARGDVVSRWLYWLHMAQVFGLPMQIFVCGMGLTLVALTVTGIIIWWRKRRSARHQRLLRAARAPA